MGIYNEILKRSQELLERQLNNEHWLRSEKAEEKEKEMFRQKIHLICDELSFLHQIVDCYMLEHLMDYEAKMKEKEIEYYVHNMGIEEDENIKNEWKEKVNKFYGKKIW